MLNQARSIFIVGIKGVAMANLALILKKLGKNVSGSDVSEKFITDELLKKNKIGWQSGFNPDGLPHNTDLVIYSAAHHGLLNPQIQQAKKRNIPVISQAEFQGKLIERFKTRIAVCGCHGKTTTSSLLSYALIKLGVKPSYMIGSPSFNGYPGGDYNGSGYFVIEADEYGVNPPQDKTPKFHFLKPNYILCTNIDFDHPDVYKDINSVKESFLKFFSKNAILKTAASKMVNKNLILCADDKNLMAVARKLIRSSYLTYGFNPSADLRIIDSGYNKYGSIFEIVGSGRNLSLHNKFSISLFGEKNILNAAGVILTLLQLGFHPDKIKSAIQDFTGAKRRFEKVYAKKDTFLFDDYAHHPNEIAATISAARNRFPKRRIIIVFQPHTYSRTQVLLKDFAKSLSLADISYILPVFASARENPKDFHVSSHDIVNLNPKNLISVDSKKQLFQLLSSAIQAQDIIFTMGAGDVYKLKDDIIEIIKRKT